MLDYKIIYILLRIENITGMPQLKILTLFIFNLFCIRLFLRGRDPSDMELVNFTVPCNTHLLLDEGGALLCVTSDHLLQRYIHSWYSTLYSLNTFVELEFSLHLFVTEKGNF